MSTLLGKNKNNILSIIQFILENDVFELHPDFLLSGIVPGGLFLAAPGVMVIVG
jgi:hypothetical protein